MLQVGGVQDAITLAPPTPGVLTAPLLLTVADAGLDDDHVRGAPVIGMPATSVTVAPIVLLAPLTSTTWLIAALLSTVSSIDCTAQVLKRSGALFAPPTLATIGVTPGK